MLSCCWPRHISIGSVASERDDSSDKSYIPPVLEVKFTIRPDQSLGGAQGKIEISVPPLQKLFWSILRLTIALSSGSLPESLNLTVRVKTCMSYPGSVFNESINSVDLRKVGNLIQLFDFHLKHKGTKFISTLREPKWASLALLPGFPVAPPPPQPSGRAWTIPMAKLRLHPNACIFVVF